MTPAQDKAQDKAPAKLSKAEAKAELARLSRSRQLLVVTHSPQVAAQATHHWRVEKSSGKAGNLTGVVALDGPARREEIARMLSGATVSDEARAAADRLIAAGGGA